ncbi:hypothetical protein [Faecalibacterium hattorii]|uniref:hypothetical protein n=1 Tax=Faecalibacterium hattorii TaxID=2935520 RepID=UPI003AAC99F4
MKKKKTAHAAQRWILSGESAAKQIGCVAGRYVFLGNHPLKVVVITVSTTTFVSRIWSEGYHGSVSVILVRKIYYGKSIGGTLLAVKHYGG